MTYVSRKEIFDLLDKMYKEEVTNEAEESLLRLFASELLRLETKEIEEND